MQKDIQLSCESAFQQKERTDFELSPLHAISDRQLIKLIACPGIMKRFNIGDLTEKFTLRGNQEVRVNTITGATYTTREEEITDRQGKPFQLEILRDLDSVVIQIKTTEEKNGKVPVVKVGLRDREFDGTPKASPQFFLHAFDGIPITSTPERSQWLGAVDWHYSGEFDKVDPNLQAVELSVVSSDPDINVRDLLVQKQLRSERERLWVDPHSLANFIDDPFAQLPEGDPPSESEMNNWYLHWWQVTNRILRGKPVALPGQTSLKAFEGFLEHVTVQSEQYIKELGYNTLSAVPTWEYVRQKFQRLGFTPDNTIQHQQAEKFTAILENMQLPHLTRRDDNFRTRDFVNRKALISWLAILPFAIQKSPNFSPTLPINSNHEKGFRNVFQAVKDAVSTNDGTVLTYPLAPGNNLWYSLSL